MSTVCDEVMKNAGRNQVLIYCHLSENTSKMAIGIRDLCKEHSSGRQLLEENSPSRQELSDKAREAEVCLLHTCVCIWQDTYVLALSELPKMLLQYQKG